MTQQTYFVSTYHTMDTAQRALILIFIIFIIMNITTYNIYNFIISLFIYLFIIYLIIYNIHYYEGSVLPRHSGIASASETEDGRFASHQGAKLQGETEQSYF
jgi:hypothetical protein